MFATTYALLFLSLTLCVVAAVAAYVAIKAAERADGTGAELMSSLRRVKALSEQVAAYDARLDKLAGRVYAQSRKPEPATESPETPEQIRARLSPRHPGVMAQLADPATHR